MPEPWENPEEIQQGIAAIDACEFLLKLLRINSQDEVALYAAIDHLDDPKLMLRKLYALNKFRVLAMKMIAHFRAEEIFSDE